MTDPHLHEIWNRTQGHLSHAADLLPAGLFQSDDGGRLDRYREWIEHNELELALDELEGLGENNRVPRQFWIHLRDAALEIQLAEHRLRFDRRLRENAG
ncbi:MAG: hypothetical protein JNK15_16985 [Planctomycetes bacterium]|nr:hypothetical protein [Planctomycetota bacterium]